MTVADAATMTYSDTLTSTVTGAATMTLSDSLTSTVTGAATMSSPSFTIKGGPSETNSAITVADTGITVGAGSAPSSDPVTINSNEYTLNSFGAATASAPSFQFTGNTDIESSSFTVSNSDTVTLTIAADGSITGPGGNAVHFPAGIVTPTISNPSPAKVLFPSGISAPGDITTPEIVVPTVSTPSAKVSFPTGVTGPALIGTSSASTPSVSISTTSVTAPGGVVTPQVTEGGDPAAKVSFPTGVSTPSIDVRPGGRVYSDGNYYVIDASDRRLKRNLSVIKDSLDKVLRLKGIYFNWIEDDVSGVRIGDKGRRHLGLIAQDVKEVVPEAVDAIGKNNKYLGVNYNALIGLLVEAMKEMHLRVEQLEQETRALREASRRT